MITMCDPNDPGVAPQEARAYAIHAAHLKLTGGDADDVAEAFAVLRQCLCVSPPPELRAKIIWKIRVTAKRIVRDDA